jgi:membrane-anchored glycerophosphoryl diester phosphodiesterase (GDPDase)
MVVLGVLLALVVPVLALYMNVRFTLVYPAIVVEENCTASGGLKRSWALTEGAFCDIWCAKTAFGLIFGLVLYANIHLLIYSGQHDNEKAALGLFVVMMCLPTFFFTPCSTV